MTLIHFLLAISVHCVLLSISCTFRMLSSPSSSLSPSYTEVTNFYLRSMCWRNFSYRKPNYCLHYFSNPLLSQRLRKYGVIPSGAECVLLTTDSLPAVRCMATPINNPLATTHSYNTRSRSTTNTALVQNANVVMEPPPEPQQEHPVPPPEVPAVLPTSTRTTTDSYAPSLFHG